MNLPGNSICGDFLFVVLFEGRVSSLHLLCYICVRADLWVFLLCVDQTQIYPKEAQSHHPSPHWQQNLPLLNPPPRQSLSLCLYTKLLELLLAPS